VEPRALRKLVLERFPALSGVAADRLDRFLAASAWVNAARGTVLFGAREPCRGFPLLLAGSVGVWKIAPSGREILLYRVEAGEGCVLSGGCLLAREEYSATGIAETDVTLVNLAPEAFHALLLEHEPFRRFVFALYGARLAEVMEVVEEVAFRRLDQRLARLLVRRGPVLAQTHQALADELGSVREIVTRLLRGFEARRWVRLERGRISVLDPKALAALARD
jgi:CRP/FNR family transcriptional regulator